MKNLRNIRYDIWASPEQYAVREITAAAWDEESEEAVVTYGPSEGDDLVELVRAGKDESGDV